MPKRLEGTPSPLQRRIRERREQLKESEHLTQTDIARAIGIESPEFITMLEQGRRHLDLNKVPRLADVLKLDRRDMCKLALYETAPSLYVELFGTSVPPSVTEAVLDKDADGQPRMIAITPELLYPVELLMKLPVPLRESVERLIGDLNRYAWPAYRGRDRKGG